MNRPLEDSPHHSRLLPVLFMKRRGHGVRDQALQHLVAGRVNLLDAGGVKPMMLSASPASLNHALLGGKRVSHED